MFCPKMYFLKNVTISFRFVYILNNTLYSWVHFKGFCSGKSFLKVQKDDLVVMEKAFLAFFSLYEL